MAGGIAAVSFEYSGKTRIAFRLGHDVRNDALEHCYQVSPVVGYRSFHRRLMKGVCETALKVSETALDLELRRKTCG